MHKIEFSNVCLIYKDNGLEYKAIQDMNFTVEAGEFVSLIGPSGCGKSSTLSVLAGLQTPTKGEFLVDGKKVNGPDKNRGVVFQHYSLFPWMTAIENVTFGIQQNHPNLTKDATRKLAEENLRKVGLEGFFDKYPYQLSGGMQQRTAIARTLAMAPDIMLMDEPFGALDARNRIIMQDLLLEVLNKEKTPKTIVFVTHDIDEAILLSDRILFMDDKHIVKEINVPFGKNRRRDDIFTNKEFNDLRKELMNCFYRSIKEDLYCREAVS